MRLRNADHTKNPMGERTKRTCVGPMCAVFVSNFNEVLKTICSLMTVSFTQLSPTLTFLPFQILGSAWYKLTAICNVDMIQDNYQSILLLQNIVNGFCFYSATYYIFNLNCRKSKILKKLLLLKFRDLSFIVSFSQL